MRAVAVLALLALLAGVLAPVTQPTSPSAPRIGVATVPATANAQLTGTTTTVQKRVNSFFQNGTGAYAGSSTVASWPTNFTAGNWSSLVAFTEVFNPVVTGGTYYPQVNLTQGSVVLANTTATIPFGVAPAFTATPVKQHTVEIYSITGGLPPQATYTVTTVATQTIQFVYSSALNWTPSASSVYTTSYPLAAYPGYWLNNSQVFLPFPAVVTGVNWSTVSVTLNGTSYSNFQVVTGGVYVNVASVGRGYTATIGAKFTVLPAIGGAAPVMIVTKFNKVNTTYDQINTSWTNNQNVAYAGEYIIQVDLAFPLNPSSLTVQAGIRVLNSAAWTLQGNTLTILPLVVQTPSASATAFFVTFQFAQAPPESVVTAATVAFESGGTSVTWGQLFLVGWIGSGVGSAIGFVVQPTRRNRRLSWNAEDRWSLTLVALAVVLFGAWFYLELAAGAIVWP